MRRRARLLADAAHDRATLNHVPGLQLPNPPPSSAAVTSVMKANRARDTKPERLLRAALRAGRPSRLSAELEAGSGSAGHLVPGAAGGDLRARLLLASLPALPPRTCPSPTPSSGRASSSSIGSATRESGASSRRPIGACSRSGSATSATVSSGIVVGDRADDPLDATPSLSSARTSCPRNGHRQEQRGDADRRDEEPGGDDAADLGRDTEHEGCHQHRRRRMPAPPGRKPALAGRAP